MCVLQINTFLLLMCAAFEEFRSPRFLDAALPGFSDRSGDCPVYFYGPQVADRLPLRLTCARDTGRTLFILASFLASDRSVIPRPRLLCLHHVMVLIELCSVSFSGTLTSFSFRKKIVTCSSPSTALLFGTLFRSFARTKVLKRLGNCILQTSPKGSSV